MVYTLGMKTKEHIRLYQKMEKASDRKQEKNDCAVKALAIATGLTYKDAHTLFEQLGRKPRSATLPRLTEAALKLLRIKTRDVTAHYKYALGAKTIRTLSRVMVDRSGVYLAYTHDHIVAIKDGVVHCWSHDYLYRVLKVVKLKKDNTR